MLFTFASFFFGLILLLLGSHQMVQEAIGIAKKYQVPPYRHITCRFWHFSANCWYQPMRCYMAQLACVLVTRLARI